LFFMRGMFLRKQASPLLARTSLPRRTTWTSAARLKDYSCFRAILLAGPKSLFPLPFPDPPGRNIGVALGFLADYFGNGRKTESFCLMGERKGPKYSAIILELWRCTFCTPAKTWGKRNETGHHGEELWTTQLWRSTLSGRTDLNNVEFLPKFNRRPFWPFAMTDL